MSMEGSPYLMMFSGGADFTANPGISLTKANSDYWQVDGITGVISDSQVGFFSGWFKASSAGNNKIFSNSGNQCYISQSATNYRLSFYFRDSSNVVALDHIFGNNAFVNGVWTHILLAWDIANSEAYGYVNGVLDATPTKSVLNSAITPGWSAKANMALGCSVNGTGVGFDGCMQEVCFNVADNIISGGEVPAATLAKFISGGKPAMDLTSAFTNAPMIYLKGAHPADIEGDLNSYGWYTKGTTMAACVDGPSD